MYLEKLVKHLAFQRENINMKRVQVSDNCFATVDDRNLIYDANSGFINLDGGVVIDTQSDLNHAQQMIDLFKQVAPTSELPKRVINTHEDGDHVWGNQLFTDSEIIGHSSLPERMLATSDPSGSQEMMKQLSQAAGRMELEKEHPGLAGMGEQTGSVYNFDGIEIVPPTTLFDDRYDLDLAGTEVNLIHVGPCHELGDTIIHVPSEGVLFTGDIVFRECTPLGWIGTYENWFKCLDLITELNPEVIVPGHGPICGMEGVRDMRDYLKYVRDEAKILFDERIPVVEAAKRIEFGPYGEWKAPSRLFFNVERAYREFRGEAFDAPWDFADSFDKIYEVSKGKGIKQEF